MHTMTSTRRSVSLLAGVVLALAACSEEDVPTGVQPTEATGRVRVVNAIANTVAGNRPVDVTLDALPVIANLAYGAAAPLAPAATYYPVYVGARQLKTVRTAAPTTTLLDQSLTIAENTDYTVLMIGSGNTAQGVVLTDANAAPAAGSVKIRVVHGAASTANVDVYITSTTADISALAPTVANVAPRTATAYQTLAAGTWRVRLTTAGTKTVVLDVNNVAVPSLGVRSVFAFDAAAGGTPLVALTLTDR